MAVQSRLTSRVLPVLAALCFVAVSTGVIPAQTSAPEPGSTWSQQDTLRIANEVQKRLGSLSTYNVFDWITFGFQGKSVVLKGYASIPVLKSDAGKVVKGIPGVDSVENEIQVLPLSNMDDRIRVGVYNRIYTQASLRKYNANQGTIGQATGPGPNVARMAGGITFNPPRGFNAIHIIVNNGKVTLYGVVDNESDKALAGMQANSTPGVFSLDNDLIVPGSAPKPKTK